MNGGQIPSPSRKLHEEAAHVAQQYKDMEDRCYELQLENNKLTTLRAEDKRIIEHLTDDKIELTRKMEWYQRRCTEITTKLHTFGQVIIDCLADTEVAEYKDNGSATEQIDSAPIERLPSVVIAGPRTGWNEQ